MSDITETPAKTPRTGGVGMDAPPAPMAYTSCRDTVRDLIQAGDSFGEVEHAIDSTELKEDAKAALWLLAFSLHDQRDWGTARIRLGESG